MPISDHWQTPPDLLKLIAVFYGGPHHDPCPANPAGDGLAVPWGKRAYVNPPFSKIQDWVDYVVINYHPQNGVLAAPDNELLFLSNHDHSTQWFEDLCKRMSAMCLFRKRIAFTHPETGEPGTINRHIQTLFYRGPHLKQFTQVFGDVGYVFMLIDGELL